MNRDISVTAVASYDVSAVTSCIREHFRMLDVASEVDSSTRILLKPNLLMKRKPEEITTTHPAVLEGIIICLSELGVPFENITLADSPGGPYTRVALNGIYEATGMKKLAQKYGIKLNDDYGYYQERAVNAKMVSAFDIINPVKDADYIIDIAKLKTHAMTTLSGAVKNLFGTVPGLMKPEFHFRFPDKNDFSNMLLDLCETISPSLIIVDAIISMEGDGPSGGTPKNTGLLLGSKNPYNMDVALCNVVNIKTDDVPTVRLAIERGLSVKSCEELNIVGDKLPSILDYRKPSAGSVDFMMKVPSWLRKPLTPLANTLLVSKPVIVKKGCIGCGKCAESCPAHTIKILDKKAYIDYSKCIKCFCCHEMCPVKTINIKRFKIFKI